LSVSTIEPRKNTAALLRAYQQFSARRPGYDLVLLGNPAWPLPADWRRAPGVRVLGYLSEADREALYASAWCLVYPSYYEGFGYPPLEAMAWGVPVIAGAVSALPEVLREAAVFIDPYRAVEEVAAALELLSDDAALHQRYREAGRALVATRRREFSLQPLLELWRSAASA
jgi:glycosyltransferase involved in cell wall biosynthesis